MFTLEQIEKQNKELVKGYFQEFGQDIGKGKNATVFFNFEKDTVIKVFDWYSFIQYKEYLENFDSEEDFMIAFNHAVEANNIEKFLIEFVFDNGYKWIKLSQQDNNRFSIMPKIYNVKIVDFSYVVEMESLFEPEYQKSELDDFCAFLKESALNPESDFNDIFARVPAFISVDCEEYFNQVVEINKNISFSKEYKDRLDFHSDNIMCRYDGLVLIDPIY